MGGKWLYFVTHQSHGVKFLHHFVVVVIAQVTPLGDKIDKVAKKSVKIDRCHIGKDEEQRDMEVLGRLKGRGLR